MNILTPSSRSLAGPGVAPGSRQNELRLRPRRCYSESPHKDSFWSPHPSQNCSIISYIVLLSKCEGLGKGQVQMQALRRHWASILKRCLRSDRFPGRDDLPVMEGVISRRPSGTRTDRFGRSLTFLKTLPPLVMIVMLTALSLGIGYLDYRTGTDTTFSAIYLFPIVAAAWFVSLPFAYGLAVLCSILWVSGDIEAGAHYGSLWVPLWNLACRFGIFVFSAHLLAALRRLHNNLEKRALERAKELTKEIAMRERLQRELLQISEREQERVGHDIH